MLRSSLITILLAGCVVDELDEFEDFETGEIDSAVTANNRLSANKLSANKLSANKLSASSMSGSAIATSGLAATVDGRDVLSYIVSCALPVGTATSVTHAGVKYTFTGQIGLAPAWLTRAPTVAERRWVTACIMARTNLYGVTVELSMRGAHAKLSSTLGEGLGYLLVEGAFYGDLFDPAGPQLYACAAEIKDLNLALSTQELRACATSSNGTITNCGFTYTGKCAVTDVSLAPACTGLLPPYKNCRAGRSASSPRFAEVVTVYLKTGL